MERKKRLLKRTASVRIEPYLAEYIQKKLEIEPETGGVKIPYTTDLYHVVWNCMAKPDPHHDVIDRKSTRLNSRIVISRYTYLPGVLIWMGIRVRIPLISTTCLVHQRKR